MVNHELDDRTAARRAIEALRGGVPNGDAVSQLGCNHPTVEGQFQDLMHGVTESLTGQAPPQGILVAGDFGSGKSHLLHWLQHRALANNFACSKVVISKETPLSDPVKFFRAAVSELRVPGRLGTGIANVTASLVYNKPRYSEFFQWAGSPESALPLQFAASLYVFEYGGDMEFRRRIERFWAGDPMTKSELSQKLRLMGQQSVYPSASPPRAQQLAFQRFAFLSRLIAAAGYAGWILLIDELELIGQYSLKTRAKAYAELARWMGLLSDSPDGVFPGIGAVGAITSDFGPAVITGGKLDLDFVPGKLRASMRDDDHALATLADRGMRFILKRAEQLQPLTDATVRKTYDDLRSIYERAYGWSPPQLAGLPAYGSSSVMRLFIRRWITEWDINRLYPGSSFVAEETPLSQVLYREDRDLEVEEAPPEIEPEGEPEQ